MDLKKTIMVQSDLELSEDQRPSENNSALIEKTAEDQKLSLESSQEQQRQSENQPAVKRKCLNEHLNAVSGNAINENNASDEMHPAHEPFTLNDSRPVSDVRTGLDTINEDCLRVICQYLNLFDIVQLGQTCMHLDSFVQRVIFPKKAKRIEIVYCSLDGITIKLDHKYSTKSLTVLTNAIKYLGKFIEEFKYFYADRNCPVNSDIWRSVMNIMQSCKHLKTLTIYYVRFHSNQVKEFQGLIGSLTSLKVLHFLDCPGLISNWSANIKQNLTIEKLLIRNSDQLEKNDNFLEHFKNISSLDLEAPAGVEVSRILNHFGHCLKRLKLNLYAYNFQNIAPIISENLKKLEHLHVTLYDEDFIYLPHLKSVELVFFKYRINTVLRKLSENGIIERLEVSGCSRTTESTNEPPLIFNKLQSLTCYENAFKSMSVLWTKAHMPVLHTVKITNFVSNFSPEVLKFITSKKTIKTIRFELPELVIPFEFWSQLVDILREPCVPNREFIHLRISSEPVIEKQAWKLLKDNRHLLKVEQERECLELIIN